MIASSRVLVATLVVQTLLATAACQRDAEKPSPATILLTGDGWGEIAPCG